MKRGLGREQGGTGRVQKLSRYSPVCCRHSPNPGFIGCLCPAALVGLSGTGREVGGLNTCPSLW